MSAEFEAPVDNAQPGRKPVRRRKMSMERVMILFALFFASGIGLLVMFPEEHPLRPFAMTIYTLLVFWLIFKFGI